MMQRETLYLLPALTAQRGPRGAFILTQKFLDGVLKYASLWPGPVTVVMQEANGQDTNLDHVAVHPDDVPFRLQWLPTTSVELVRSLTQARVVLASLVDCHAAIGRAGEELNLPIVYITEYTLETRRRIIRAETSNPFLRWRREWWNTQLELQYQDAIRRASGVQCNGLPTYHAYRKLNERAMIYFDTRVRAHQVVSEEALLAKQKQLLRGEPLRLAFSGRLIAMKGADHLPVVAAELRSLGVRFTLDICGGGDLVPVISRKIRQLGLESAVRMRGVLDFQKDLVPFIANEIDLFVCCHRQGDPSCTYLETMSCGTPIVGYDNEAFATLVRHCGTGWLSPLDQPRALARRIAQIDRDRPGLARAAAQAREFALGHTFENTMEMRIDHLLSCVNPLRVEAKAS